MNHNIIYILNIYIYIYIFNITVQSLISKCLGSSFIQSPHFKYFLYGDKETLINPII